MRKIVLFTLLIINAKAQMITILSEDDKQPVNGATLITKLRKGKGESLPVPSGVVKLDYNKNTTPYDKDIYDYDPKCFTEISGDGFVTIKVYPSDFKKNNYTFYLKRNKIYDDYYIKLAALKKPLTNAQIKQIKSQINVEEIEVIRKKNGLYSYITPKVQDIHKAIITLRAIKDSKNPTIQNPYILHNKDRRVWFRLQFGVISRNTLAAKVSYYEKLYGYKVDPIKTADGFYRLVSEKYYGNFIEAQNEFIKIVPFTDKDVQIIAYENINGKASSLGLLKIK